MPFPWKRNKVTRISQIVADLQSPKRGGSLVVETGFPTSLIDLFVKNRSRFRKPKSRKPVHPEISDPPRPPPALSRAPRPPLLEPPETAVSSGFTVVSGEAPSLMRLVTGNDNVHGDDGVAGSAREVDRVGECGGGSGSKKVLAAILKMFVVLVVLITSVKELTVGITISAISLVFLENTGKRVVSCFKPCSDANVGMIKFLTQRVSNCVWFQRLQLKIKKNCEGSESLIVEGENIVVSELVFGYECSSNSNSISFEEIDVVESKSEVVGVCCEEACFDGPELACVNGIGDNKWGCPEMQEASVVKVVDSCEISQCKTKDSRSVKFKSKMKKLVPTKLRCSKKEKRERKSKERKIDTNSEGYSTAKEDKSPGFEIEEEQEGVGKVEEENENKSPLLLKIELECIREDEVDHGITCSQDTSLARVEVEEVAVNSEEKRIDRFGNSGYIILFVIALAGLVVGRFSALILTMTWCFMIKIVTTRGRSQNVSLIKCSVPKS